MTPTRRAAMAAAALAACLAVGGCCGHPCYDEDSLPRTRLLASPYDAVDFVRFCVRHELWGPLYGALSAETKRTFFEDEAGDSALGEFEFAFGFPRLTYGRLDQGASAGLREVRLADMIHEAAIILVGSLERPWLIDPGEPVVQVVLDYAPIDLSLTTFLLVNEGSREAPRWKLGIAETVRWWQRTGVIGAGP